LSANRTGTGSITHSISPAPAGIYDLELGNIGQAMMTATIRVYLDNQLVRQETSTEGSLRLTYSTPYVTGFRLSFPSLRQILYEEGIGANVQGRYDCGTASSWNPSTDPVTFTIVSGSQYAQFWEVADPFFGPRTPKGTTVTTLNSTMIILAADGRLPDSAGVWVAMTAESNGIVQRDSALIKPYFYSVQVDPVQIESGGESILHIRTVDVNGNEHFRNSQGTLAQVRLADSFSRYGTLWYGYEGGEAFQVGDTLKDVEASFTVGASGIQLKFLANEQTPADTTPVVIIVEKTGEGSSTEFIPLEVFPYSGRDSVKGLGRVSLIGRPSEFARFEIALSKDTLNNQDVSNAKLTAVDEDGNEVFIDGLTPINLLFLEGGEFAEFITLTGDTVNTPPNVPYDTLRLNGVRVVARGTSSTQPPVIVASLGMAFASVVASNADTTTFRTDFPRTVLKATSATDVTKVGFKNIIMKPEIKVVASDSVKPYYPGVIDTSENRVSVKVAVTVSGILYTALPYRVNLSSFPVEGSGGHDHTANRPSGYFLNGRNDTLRTQEFETGRDTIRTRYQPSMFGGKEAILASLVLFPPAITGADTVVVRVPGLVPFEGIGNYSLTGSISPHSNNHYFCSRRAVDSLINAANEFANVDWNTTGEMRLNDMSLNLGGGFDLKSRWKEDISLDGRGHKLHRLGKSVDIENIVTKDTVVNNQLLRIGQQDWVDQFKRLMRDRKFRFVDEKQTVVDTTGERKRPLFPHFEWEGR